MKERHPQIGVFFDLADLQGGKAICLLVFGQVEYGMMPVNLNDRYMCFVIRPRIEMQPAGIGPVSCFAVMARPSGTGSCSGIGFHLLHDPLAALPERLQQTLIFGYKIEQAQRSRRGLSVPTTRRLVGSRG